MLRKGLLHFAGIEGRRQYAEDFTVHQSVDKDLSRLQT